MDDLLRNKLKIRQGSHVLVINPPAPVTPDGSGFESVPLSRKKYEYVLVFANVRSDVGKFTAKAIKALSDNGWLWFFYPKKSSGIKTDLNRDFGWDALKSFDFEAVSQVAIDSTWSALRFKPATKIKVMSRIKPATNRKKFIATLEKPQDGIDGAFISIPFNIQEVFGTKGQVKVKASFDGYPYRGIIANMGTGSHVIIVRKDIRQAIGKNAGDKITVEIERDYDERVIEIPEDLKNVLEENPKAYSFFNSLSFTNRKEYVVWITSAKKIETREKRLSETRVKLLAEKKNPSQK